MFFIFKLTFKKKSSSCLYSHQGLIYIIGHIHPSIHSWNHMQDCWGIKSALQCFKTTWQSSRVKLSKLTHCFCLFFPLNCDCFLSSLPPSEKILCLSIVQLLRQSYKTAHSHALFHLRSSHFKPFLGQNTPPIPGVTERMSSEGQRWFTLLGEKQKTSRSVTVTFKFTRKVILQAT